MQAGPCGRGLDPRAWRDGSSASRFLPFSDCDATARMRKQRPFADGLVNWSSRPLVRVRDPLRYGRNAPESARRHYRQIAPTADGSGLRESSGSGGRLPACHAPPRPVDATVHGLTRPRTCAGWLLALTKLTLRARLNRRSQLRNLLILPETKGSSRFIKGVWE
jgi:hypothetical protein